MTPDKLTHHNKPKRSESKDMIVKIRVLSEDCMNDSATDESFF